MIKLYKNITNINTKDKIKPTTFRNEFSGIMKEEEYDIGKLFFFPSNYGNYNFKFSLFFSIFLKIYDKIFYKDDNNNLNSNNIIKES